ncbi:DUF3488 and transglutaminase-like domain-containing protein [Parafrigoribacterium soli]|uniref:DUF3488 and transglutaminase-like domain-containing protein n=1 Tax=Parafrigoribacterium soli TaxID=3144663 RepID=UPI0032F00203
MTTHTPRASFIVVNTAMMWLATAVASVALWPIYRSQAIIVLVAITTVAASALAILGALYRWRSYVMLLATFGLYLLLGVPLAVPDRALYTVLPSIDGILALLSGAALGWKQLLTITLPVGSYQALLVPTFLLVLVTVVVGLSLALRSRRGDLGALAPAVLFITALAFGPERATWPLQVSLGLLATLLVWLAWRRWHRRREAIRLLARVGTAGDGTPATLPQLHGFSGFRALLSAGIILAIAAASGIAASVLAPPTGPREVVRSAIVQPFDPLDHPSPLSGFRSYEKSPRAGDTMLVVTGLPAGSHLRIATLDSYNGVVYSVGSGQPDAASGSFTRVPYTFDQSAVRGRQLTLTVSVGDYSGVWVPTIGKLESIDFRGSRATTLRDSFYYNDNSGTAAVVRPLTKGDSYRLTAVQPVQPSAAQLASLKPGTARVPDVEVVPDSLLTVLNGYVGGTTGEGPKLVAMLAGLKKNGYISHGVAPNEPLSRSGHAADRITQLLTEPRMIGDQEQYAVTAALMARQLGFPARVVFGFAPATVSVDGSTVIRGKDVSAWIEVDTAQYGWVTIDPNPPVREIPKEQPKDPKQIARPQSPVQPPPEQPHKHETQTPPDSTQDNPADADALLAIIFAVLRITGWVLLAIAIALSPFLAVIAAKYRRRVLRRRAPLTVDRISGGWQEFEDAVIDHGFVAPASSTRTEIAGVVGGMQPLVLASIADRAVFSPNDPSDDEADQLWRSVRELRSSLDDGLTRWERIKALISVRSLGGYSVKNLFKR